MDQKLIFLDIDGTLTEPGTNIPPASALEAIRKAQANGHKVLLSSGRNYGMLSPLLQYQFDGLIASAGGYIEWNNKPLYDCPMTPEEQNKALSVLKKSGVYCTIESKHSTYTEEGFKDFLQEHAKNSGNSELLRWREQLESNLGIQPMANYQGEPIYKIIFMTDNKEKLQKPMEALQDSFDFCVQDVDPYGFINGELINKKFNKGLAVKRLCTYLNIPLENTIAFGDSMNDLEMIQTAGLGICMGNGSETLKKLADEICPSVTENGLYQAFQKHGLL